MNALKLVFIKLGGSLITDKHHERTARIKIIEQLAREIKETQLKQPELRILVGHGSGSFGHSSAARNGTRAGVKTQEGWQGFAEVWSDARTLNNLVIDAFSQAGVPVISVAPSATTITRDRQIGQYQLGAIQHALDASLVPVIQGDVVFDEQLGGTILSTEDLFHYLAPLLKPAQILMLGQEPGVWADYPVCSALVSMITPTSLAEIEAKLRGSSAVDVTGGMFHKVTSMLELVQQLPELTISIFSGETPGSLAGALEGEEMGTKICNLPEEDHHQH